MSETTGHRFIVKQIDNQDSWEELEASLDKLRAKGFDAVSHTTHTAGDRYGNARQIITVLMALPGGGKPCKCQGPEGAD